MIEEKKTCTNCGALYDIKHDLPEEDYIEKFCPFCGHENEIEEDVILSIDARIKYNDNHYEFTDVNTSKEDFKGVQLDSYALTNAGLTYRFNVGDNIDDLDMKNTRCTKDVKYI